ncbi:carph-isopro domain-containing protein [Nonomuraea sp. NPDC049714]|uniref:carph-isopro domain-containing protein n=1 Tax=Nonomuraea sp. NPDC049714 TaxID=3364357 RepID=UPI00379D3A49
MTPQPKRSNPVLAACLEELGWSPKALARKLNKVFGPGTVAESAPYHWRDSARVPRSPLPMMTAYVLSQEMGRVMTVGQLWQGRAPESPMLIPAGGGMELPWTAQALWRIVEDWVVGGLVDRRQFLAISGSGLTAVVAHYLDGTAGRGRYLSQPTADTSEASLIEQIESQLPRLQALDDEHGGARHLGYIGAQFRSIGFLLHESGHSDAVTARLLQALAEVGQLAGWMAFDAAHHGLAQRYFVTALRAAHQVNDLPLCAHILADLSFQAASRDHPADAITLGEAARRASDAAPAAVRSSVLSRLAFAYATAGRYADFQRSRSLAGELVDQPLTGYEPRWMYFLTPNHLDCQAGYALIHLGMSRQQDGITTKARTLLGQGIDLLQTGAHGRSNKAEHQRRALFEGAWLALGNSAQGELESACRIGEIAAQRLSTVRSPRSTELLRRLAVDLRRRQRNPFVGSFLPRLEHALCTANRS